MLLLLQNYLITILLLNNQQNILLLSNEQNISSKLEKTIKDFLVPKFGPLLPLTFLAVTSGGWRGVTHRE